MWREAASTLTVTHHLTPKCYNRTRHAHIIKYLRFYYDVFRQLVQEVIEDSKGAS